MSDTVLAWTLLIVAGGIIGTAIYFFVNRAAYNSLPARFARLNPVKGKSRAAIVAGAGSPKSVSTVADGKKLLQWMEGSYHIALIFDANDICEGVTHEYSAAGLK